MAKKVANADINMSETIRELLTGNRKLTNKQAVEAVLEKHPGAKINRNSFSVAFYNGRKKLGIKSSGRGRGRKPSATGGGVKATIRKSVNLDMLHAAAKFLKEAGSADAAYEAIKQVQAVQVK